ncbi:hypothetical protein M427DRAFT_357446 [Gonapodya prolifera JEL478]|uniref:Uncharacterized protein n=1 Tax=Gonapodya prolifera (strain JEL478) TaxID=1344416 RepID=A0A139AB44_GONPJ|nr:hypothetical protein M427DRAFT_357446 [Gonapodya prolifera JEL478]|eukprot:KXS14051.1 hypothetical protein M427DRAFT_357446 [Gonapodya prolifera JEL478]
MSDVEALQKQLEEVLKKNADLEAANRKLSEQLASTSAKPAPLAVAAEGATAPVSGTIQFKEPTKKAAPSPVATPASEGRVSTSDAPPPALSRRGSVMTIVAQYHGPEADPEDDEPERIVVVIPADSVNGREIDPFAHGALDLAVKSLVKVRHAGDRRESLKS